MQLEKNILNKTDGFQATHLDCVQGLRGIAAMVVVIYHFNAVEIYLDQKVEQPFFSIFEFFGFGGVNLFFVLSGFIITWVSYSHLGNPAAVPEYISKRLIRLFPIFWVVFAAAFFVNFIVFGDAYCVDEAVFPHIVETSLLLIGPQNCFIPQAWSLGWELLFYSLFILLFFAPRILLMPAMAAWGLSIMTAPYYDIYDWIPRVVLNPQNLQFIGGSMVAYLALRNWLFTPKLFIAIGLGWFSVSVWLNIIGTYSTENIWHRVGEFGVASMFVLYGCVGIELGQRDAKPWPRWLIILGDASYSLYLTHLTSFFVWRRLWTHLPHSLEHHILFASLMISTAVIVGIGTYYLVERPVLSWFRKKQNTLTIYGALSGGLVATIFVGTVVTKSYDQILPRQSVALSVIAEVVESDDKTVLIVNDQTLLLEPNPRGEINAIDRKGGKIRIEGWAVDQRRNTTAQYILVFIDGTFVRAVEPTQERWFIRKLKQEGGRRPGFTIELTEVNDGSVRIFARFDDERGAEIPVAFQ